jgi:hypothetical protein
MQVFEFAWRDLLNRKNTGVVRRLQGKDDWFFLRGIEAMNIIRKRQVKGINLGNSVSQVKFINEIFGVIA